MMTGGHEYEENRESQTTDVAVTDAAAADIPVTEAAQTPEHGADAIPVPPVERQRCGYIAVLGLPNVGKSTLINRMVGYKVSIVSPKVQTTRKRVLGIMVRDETQMIFIDTPGIFNPTGKALDKAMAEQAWGSLAQADLFVWVIDAAAPDFDRITGFIKRLPPGKPCVLVLNKIDKVSQQKLLPRMRAVQELRPDADVLMVSALKDDGVDYLLDYLAQRMSQGPWLYPADQLTDLPQRLWASEITREQLFYQLHHELPYQLYVETEAWEEFDNGSVCISQAIVVAKEGQKHIIIGAKGSRLKAIGQAARVEMMRHLERTVHLKLFVKVREDWYDKTGHVGQVL